MHALDIKSGVDQPFIVLHTTECSSYRLYCQGGNLLAMVGKKKVFWNCLRMLSEIDCWE